MATTWRLLLVFLSVFVGQSFSFGFFDESFLDTNQCSEVCKNTYPLHTYEKVMLALQLSFACFDKHNLRHVMNLCWVHYLAHLLTYSSAVMVLRKFWSVLPVDFERSQVRVTANQLIISGINCPHNAQSLISTVCTGGLAGWVPD